ncbi:hypothetical protein SLS56_007705 [Neofusicoccum ribis]|uniref:Uncharacterized protein n=1 Tax=Neofusicoccum ribis TaxID=45134 RepID=A0ABR3SM97_9PEZI
MTSHPSTATTAHASLLYPTNSPATNGTNKYAENYGQVQALEPDQRLSGSRKSTQGASRKPKRLFNKKMLASRVRKKLKHVKPPKSKSKKAAPSEWHSKQTTPNSIKTRGSATAHKTKKTKKISGHAKPGSCTEHIRRMMTEPIRNHDKTIEGVGPFLARIQSERGEKTLEQHSGAPTPSNQATLVIRTRKLD